MLEGLRAFNMESRLGEGSEMRGVTESTIVATIHCPDVGYCQFRNPLVTQIPYHVPSLLL